MGPQEVPFKVESSWFTGEAQLMTYHLEELVGPRCARCTKGRRDVTCSTCIWR